MKERPGLSFIMLISSLIYHDMVEASKAVKGKNIETCLLEARMVRVHKRHGKGAGFQNEKTDHPHPLELYRCS